MTKLLRSISKNGQDLLKFKYQSVDLSFNNLDDECLILLLSELTRFSVINIQQLILSGNSFGHKGLAKLLGAIQSGAMSQLHTVVLNDCNNVSRQDEDEIKHIGATKSINVVKHNPRCKAELKLIELSNKLWERCQKEQLDRIDQFKRMAKRMRALHQFIDKLNHDMYICGNHNAATQFQQVFEGDAVSESQNLSEF